MSVPKWKRGDGDLNIFIESQEFAIYIFKITTNENVFLSVFKDTITIPLTNLARDIYLNLWKANNIRLTPNTLATRQSFQKLALQEITDFLALWNLAKRAFHLKHNRIEYAIGKLMAIEEATKKWMKYDITKSKVTCDTENNAV